MPYETVIGLEIHAQLKTATKLFCGDTTTFGKEPNTQVSPVSLGHPGTLPQLNANAIELAIRLGLATHCTIVQQNYFARKNYFYPDLPKGYQISQHTTPICRDGFLEINADNTTRKIRINRIHMEEDAGKSMHDESSDCSLLDFNRAGMPLLEIVTEPDIRTAAEAAAFVTQIRKLVRYLDVCDGNMEEGSLRCDVNISVRPLGDAVLGTKVEIKNLNSIKFIRKAAEYEAARLIQLHEQGKPILQQTRGFDEQQGTTYAIRTKEGEDDYRYFPEPDLPPFFIPDETINSIRNRMPARQEDLRNELESSFGLSEYDSGQLAADTDLFGFFQQLVQHTKHYKAAANWVIGPLKNHLATLESASGLEALAMPLATLIRLIEEGIISNAIAVQKIFPALMQDPLLNIEEFIKEKGLFVQTSQGALDTWISQALEKHASKITEYKKGKKGLLSLFVGEVMKLSGGTADARVVTQMITEKLNARS